MTKTLLAAALLALMPGLTLAQASQAKTTAKTNTAAKASPAKTEMGRGTCLSLRIIS